ncbi:MAG: hypothetical protein ISF22_10935 [Methanomassiliicoccus sp.]|nr:hypothetical protein [Methanomassiliicoccus sp.]
MPADDALLANEVKVRPQLATCPRCGAWNTLSASYCIGCGAFLPPPVGRPSNYGGVPMPVERTGISFPLALLIIALVLAVVLPLLFFLFLVAI